MYPSLHPIQARQRLIILLDQTHPWQRLLDHHPVQCMAQDRRIFEPTCVYQVRFRVVVLEESVPQKEVDKKERCFFLNVHISTFFALYNVFFFLKKKVL
jgi:hypothetical protein